MEIATSTRSCIRDRNPSEPKGPRGSKQICIPLSREQYDAIWGDSCKVRQLLDRLLKESPELFPATMSQGYQLSGKLPESKKMEGIQLRQLRTAQGVYSLRPSFVMSYMSGTVEELENPLLLLSMGVPYWVVTHIFGHNDMFWQRHLERLGRNSLVGTSVPQAEHLPEHLAADEHHVDWCGEKGYVAFTAGGGCILGVALSPSADEEHLTQAYGEFAQEAQALDEDYTPQTVNTDGWWATQNAFKSLFSSIVPILCFLHGFLKIRDRCRKAYELHQQIWSLYRAESKEAFFVALAQFQLWFDTQQYSQSVVAMVEKLSNRAQHYAVSYDHPQYRSV